jgi:hypothetical protein
MTVIARPEAAAISWSQVVNLADDAAAGRSFILLVQNKRTKQKDTPLCWPIGFTALLGSSGDWPKLASAHKFVGTNLDAGGARRVCGMDATSQTLPNPYPDKPALLVSTQGGLVGFKVSGI